MKAVSLYPDHVFKKFIFLEVNLNSEYMGEHIIQGLL